MTVLILGLLINAIALPIVARRLWFLFRLIRSGQPAPERIQGVTSRLGQAIKTEVVEVLGQRRLLKWTVPGTAHFFTFWAFMILGTVYVEAYGVMLGPDDFAIPVIGHWWILGFLQDLIALAVLVAIVVFASIRVKNAPAKLGRKSRFKGSHEFGAYLVLFFIFNVVWTMFLFRGAASQVEHDGHANFRNSGAFVSNAVGSMLSGLSEGTLEVLEGVGLLLHIGVMLVFLIEVVHSKHLHIMAAPVNVLFKRQPIALGATKPLTAGGKTITLDDIDEIDEDTTFGVGKIEDFTWKGILDFATCTECGRCQSQCPAWNTEKPLSPKLLIMNLRNHAYAKGPWILTDEDQRESLPAATVAEAERPLVGATEGEPFMPTGGAVIDDEVLWSCVTCGACVQQCPVDIEHVDHVVDMRRYQVLVESSFPAELNGLFKGMENRGNPWNMAPSGRMDWAKGLDFDIPVVGEDLESLESVDWLFWVGCAGAYEDRAKKTTQAVAELLNIAGISFGVLGTGETCTGDSARRAGNEFVFQGLAQQNVETFKEFKVKKAVTTCAHCFNTLKNEYREFGIELEVVHHTQLLNRLVREGKLTPIASGAGAAKRSITYHDPCYLGRHNQVYAPPRELLSVLPGAEYREMPRNSERSFCCGAGGARMWMEEKIGTRINENRTDEAVATGADQIAVGCPFCRVMLSDGLTTAKANGTARDEVEVLDVAQMLLASVKGEPAVAVAAATPAPGPAAPATALQETPAPAEAKAAEQPAPPVEEPAAPAGAAPTGGSLFDAPAPAEAPVAPPAPAPAAGGSLFDAPAPAEAPAAPEAKAEPEPPAPAAPAAPASDGSLFDIPAPAEKPAAPEAKAEPTPDPAPPAPTPPAPIATGSLFDIPAPAETPAAPEAKAEPTPDPAPPAPTPPAPIPSGSLFDIPAPAETPAETPPASEAADVETILDVDDAPAEPVAEEPATDEPVAEEPPVEEPVAEEPAAPAAPGEAHHPRTDADIHGATSLFDI
ncbi:MAG: (Fe-S)-binding protein [Nocardioidaceae bacterium]